MWSISSKEISKAECLLQEGAHVALKIIPTNHLKATRHRIQPAPSDKHKYKVVIYTGEHGISRTLFVHREIKNPKPDDSVLCHFHYVTTQILVVRIHPVLLSVCVGPGHSRVSPSGYPFAQPCDDTRNYWGSQSCKLPVFTRSGISVGAFLPDVAVCCTGQNFNKVSAPGRISETCAFNIFLFIHFCFLICFYCYLNLSSSGPQTNWIPPLAIF